MERLAYAVKFFVDLIPIFFKMKGFLNLPDIENNTL